MATPIDVVDYVPQGGDVRIRVPPDNRSAFGIVFGDQILTPPRHATTSPQLPQVIYHVGGDGCVLVPPADVSRFLLAVAGSSLA